MDYRKGRQEIFKIKYIYFDTVSFYSLYPKLPEKHILNSIYGAKSK